MEAQLIIDFYKKNAIGKSNQDCYYLINYEHYSQTNFLLNYDKIYITPLDLDFNDLQIDIQNQYKLLQKKYNFEEKAVSLRKNSSGGFDIYKKTTYCFEEKVGSVKSK